MPEVAHDIFGPGSNVEGRVFRDYDQLTNKIDSCKRLGLKIVLTSGSFDLFHIGHSRYIEKAKEQGDILVVGVDSDDKIKKRKGPHRSIVSEEERMEILCHCRHVDIIFLKQAEETKWRLIKTVRPDVLIISQREYKKKDTNNLNKYCGEVILLKSQATTSTTARIRRILIEPANEIKERLKSVIKEVCGFLDDLTGGAQ